MGLTYSNSMDEQKLVPYPVEKSEADTCLFDVNGKKISPEGICALILSNLKASAEDYLGEKVSQIVITVPAYFTHNQRRAILSASAISGLGVMRILSSPNAAAFSHGFEKRGDGLFAFLDLGGGTFDINILEISEGVINVISTNGHTCIGGDNIDQVIIDWLVDGFIKEEGIDLRRDLAASLRLKEAAETAKVELSSSSLATINLPFISGDARNPKHLQRTISRDFFETMLDPILQRINQCCKNALKDAKLTPHDLDQVIMAGGSMRIPKVQGMVKQIFEKGPHRGINRDETVAAGAAVCAGILMGDVKGMLLIDVTTLSLGINANTGQMSVIIPRNTTIPTKRSEVFTTTTDNQVSLDIEVVQGDRPLAEGNTSLGKVHLHGIERAPRGVPKIEIIFDIDPSGLAHITARDQKTGTEISCDLKSPGINKWDNKQIVEEEHIEHNTASSKDLAEPPTSPAKRNPFTSGIKEKEEKAAWNENMKQGPILSSWLRRLTGRNSH